MMDAKYSERLWRQFRIDGIIACGILDWLKTQKNIEYKLDRRIGKVIIEFIK